jgi:hypothetical protein
MPRTPADSRPAKPPKWIARAVASVVAVGSGGVTIYGLFRDKRVAIFAFIGVVAAIVLLIVVEQAVREARERKGEFYSHLAKCLIAFVFLYFVALMVALFPALYRWLTNPDPAPPTPVVLASPTSAPSTSSPPAPAIPDNAFAGLADTCKAPPLKCTVFLFDYLNDNIQADELQAFQNIQTDRLDKGIRSHLQTFDLLKGIDFQVMRCSAAKIKERAYADRAIETLKVPAIMWGFIKKLPDNKLVSTTTITLTDTSLRHVGSREELGADITQLLDLAKPIQGNPLAMASLIIGDVHLRTGKPEFARKAFLHAQLLAEKLDATDREDFLAALSNRLQQLDTVRPPVNLQPIGGNR